MVYIYLSYRLHAIPDDWKKRQFINFDAFPLMIEQQAERDAAAARQYGDEDMDVDIGGDNGDYPGGEGEEHAPVEDENLDMEVGEQGEDLESGSDNDEDVDDYGDVIKHFIAWMLECSSGRGLPQADRTRLAGILRRPDVHLLLDFFRTEGRNANRMNR